ncbi:MAG TPA: family 20 glycosylhydrolase, partial [Rhodanobacteraceae bacterium]|nr:family 20 glycosylhydrolase [Rhodanobacteraceae bacterium]
MHKRTGWLAVAILALGVGVACAAPAATVISDPAPAVQPPLVPLPARITLQSGSFTVTAQTPVLANSGDAATRFTVEHFISTLARTSALHLRSAAAINTPARGAIEFVLDPGAPVAQREGYAIDVSAAGIRVVARNPSGLYYGSVTLWQLLTPGGVATDAVKVPVLHIEDWPRFQWRGLMLDSARHFQSVADIEKLLDWMSLDKLNVLHWHLTDDQGWRLEVPKYPLLTKIGGCRKAVGPDAALTGGPDKPY